MAEAVVAPPVDPEANGWVVPRPNVSHIITEDDEPVDNLPSEKQQRLLVEPLYTASVLARPFLAAANVGVFFALNQAPVVPDMFLSLGVEVADDWWAQEHRSYFLWEFGKPPDVAIEIVSNRRGGEMGRKFERYAQVGVPYYVIFDPQQLVQASDLQVYELQVGEYRPRPDHQLPRIKLALTLWEGVYEDKADRWLRWCDAAGQLLPTGAELAHQERQRAEQAHHRAEQAYQQAEQERQRAERLAARLRELGLNPDE
jgi:Uma2 family endonuclease